MPLYEYQCEACGHRFELIRKFSDPPLQTCPSCSSGTVQKLQSASAFRLKGTGWYVTDYAKKDTKTDQATAGKTDQAAAAKADGGSSGAAREGADNAQPAGSRSPQPAPASSSAPAAPAAPSPATDS